MHPKAFLGRENPPSPKVDGLQKVGSVEHIDAKNLMTDPHFVSVL